MKKLQNCLGERLQVDNNLYLTKVLFNEGIDKTKKKIHFSFINLTYITFDFSAEFSSTYVGSNFQNLGALLPSLENWLTFLDSLDENLGGERERLIIVKKNYK